MFIVIQ